ncbi:phasin family protein [Janthinobacterium sp. 17J80-10]|uniref:phasin family protein n=1 Tax=Janthinobacterium sp. 17J80-10 TaxID=2497863 RepID=UPI0013E8F548|nr:phasin family protein [Janthinobacterium sp. 17J80-10]
MYQTQLEASRRLADAFFSGAEKIDHVLLTASHRAWTDQLRFVQSLVAVRDPQGAADAQAKFFSLRPDRAMNYQRDLMKVFTEVQSEIGKSMRSYVEQVGSGVAPDFAAGIAPEDTSEQETYNPIAANPLTGMFTAWQSAFREAASAANRNMETARNTFENAASAGYEHAEQAVDDAVDEMTAGREKRSTAHHNGKRK